MFNLDSELRKTILYATNNSNLHLPPQSLLRKLPVTRTEAATDEHKKRPYI